MDLFGNEIDGKKKKREASKPLAERLRPESLDDFFGQSHLIGEGKPIRTMLGKGELVSMILPLISICCCALVHKHTNVKSVRRVN